MLPTGTLRPSTAPCNGFGLLRGTEGQDERWPKSTRLADDSGGAELLSGLPEGGSCCLCAAVPPGAKRGAHGSHLGGGPQGVTIPNLPSCGRLSTRSRRRSAHLVGGASAYAGADPHMYWETNETFLTTWFGFTFLTTWFGFWFGVLEEEEEEEEEEKEEGEE